MCAADPSPAELAGSLADLIEATGATASGPEEYGIAGHTLRVHYGDAAVRAALSPAIEHLLGASGAGDGLDLFVRSGAPAPPPGGAAPGAIRPRIHAADGPVRGVFYPASGIWGALDSDRGRAVWWVPDPERLPAPERSGPFRTILQWWLSRRNLQIAHAGAVGNAGAAVLLVGRGGSGKSVTALACATRGLAYLGDDSVLCAVGPAPVVHCLYACATVFPEDVARFPGLPALPLGEGKVLLDLRGRVARSLPLGALLVPRVTGRVETRLSPISGTEALRALAPSSLLNVPGSGAAAFARLADLVRRVPGYALELGTDLARVAEAIERLLEKTPRR